MRIGRTVDASPSIGSRAIGRKSPANVDGAIAVTRHRPRPASAISWASRRLPATTYEWPIVTRWRSAGMAHLVVLGMPTQRAPTPQRGARDRPPVAPHARKAAHHFA